MATQYSDIYNVFLGKVVDYDLPTFNDTDREEILFGFMKSACVKFKKVCHNMIFIRWVWISQ